MSAERCAPEVGAINVDFVHSSVNLKKPYASGIGLFSFFVSEEA